MNSGLKYKTVALTIKSDGSGKLENASTQVGCKTIIGVFIVKNKASKTNGYAIYNKDSDIVALVECSANEIYDVNIVFI